MKFSNVAGFYAFTSLIILILIYLKNPHPKDVNVPSLMFLVKNMKNVSHRSFLLRKLLRNLLFFLHFLAIVAMALSITMPTVAKSFELSADNTVLVIDTSASSQAEWKNGKTRFEHSIDLASKELGGKVSIILAENVPLILLERGSKRKASSMLSTIKASDTTSNIGDAILAAKNIIKGLSGRVIVYSDFIKTEGIDTVAAKKVLTSNGIEVTFVDTSLDNDKADNVGFVDYKYTDGMIKLYIKNFADEEKTVTLSLNKKQSAISVLPRSIETYEMEIEVGFNEIQIVENDKLMLDNTLYFSVPEKDIRNILLITNDRESHVEVALNSLKDVELEVAEPPILPKEFTKYDLIIFSNFKADSILAGTFDDVASVVRENGVSVIIKAVGGLTRSQTENLLPVEITEKVEDTTSIRSNIVNSYTKDIEFGGVDEYYDSTVVEGEGALVIADSSTGQPLIVEKEDGAGRVLYMAFDDDFAGFRFTPDYPIFWKRVVDSFTKSTDIKDFNLKTGTIINFAESQTIETPSGKIKTDSTILNKVGKYEYRAKTIAVNLLNMLESDVDSANDIALELKVQGEGGEEKGKSDGNYPIELPIILLAIILLIVEMVIIKVRGEI